MQVGSLLLCCRGYDAARGGGFVGNDWMCGLIVRRARRAGPKRQPGRAGTSIALGSERRRCGTLPLRYPTCFRYSTGVVLPYQSGVGKWQGNSNSALDSRLRHRQKAHDFLHHSAVLICLEQKLGVRRAIQDNEFLRLRSPLVLRTDAR
jgi:hypothetical protein